MLLGIKALNKTNYELNMQNKSECFFHIEINRKYMATRKRTLLQQQKHKIHRSKLKNTDISFCWSLPSLYELRDIRNLKCGHSLGSLSESPWALWKSEITTLNASYVNLEMSFRILWETLTHELSRWQYSSACWN